MNKASLTSKGQVTIPKEIRDFLDLNTGDQLQFQITDEESKIVTLKKYNKKSNCPACHGKVTFEEYKLPCFVCDQTSYITHEEQLLLFLLQIPFRKYKVGYTLIQQELKENSQIEYRQIPKFILKSEEYPKELLNYIQDSLQMMIIEEYTPKSISDSTKFMIPSDIILEEILELLTTEKAKEKVKKWFRYDRTT